MPRGADSNAIQRAYRKKMSEVKGKDEAAVQRIEAAHSAIMMAALTSRLAVRPACSLLAPVLLLLRRAGQHAAAVPARPARLQPATAGCRCRRCRRPRAPPQLLAAPLTA